MTNTIARRPPTFLLALLAAFMALPASCATMQPVVTKVTHVVDCSASAVVSQLPAIVTDVATDLLSRDYLKLLTDLAKRVGDDAVVCAVASSAAGAKARMAAGVGAQPNADTIATNGEAYLKQREVTFAAPPAAPTMGAVTCSPACDACHTCTFVPVTGQKPMNPWHCFSTLPKPSGCP